MCLVCGSEELEPHFAGFSCRACAAFFRRYFHSKKLRINCTCESRFENSHPCRRCRIAKCLAAGMNPEKVQPTRDKHCRKVQPNEMPSPLLPTHLVSRDTSNLSAAIFNWHQFEKVREEMNGGKIGSLNIFQLTCSVNTDIDLTWKMVTEIFPSFSDLRNSDKNALLRNFVPKLWQIEPILDHIYNWEKYENFTSKDVDNLIISFYQGSYKDGCEMPRSEILKLFRPIWMFYIEKMIFPIVSMELGKPEVMAIIWMLFFDHGYTNISSDCSEMCRNVKKVIMRELRNFQEHQNFEENRFIETIEVLEIIERGERKFMEELIICEINNIRIDEDFKMIIEEIKI